MQCPVRCVGRTMGAMLATTCALSIAAWAGGAGFGDDDDNSEEEGPSYFGFVRDTNGATVPNCGREEPGGIVTRTDLRARFLEADFMRINLACASPTVELIHLY